MAINLLGLRTVIYPAPDLEASKAWWTALAGVEPYFDEPFYVGFNIGGYELGLNPDHTLTAPGRGGTVGYWRVSDINTAVAHFAGFGAGLAGTIQDVGGDIKVAEVFDPFGNLIGLIENPHFTLK